ncbi:aminoglycoside 6-adenylyltransferase [Paenibacillus sp. GCM10027629]|uniref:aminoglycoside 6-adenylyltransferase n=1 Tax=Paenibacillus sp. GCM10027629 TaxID=3273414 RepID=UPI0036262829
MLSTYNMGSIEVMWESMDTCVSLFRETARTFTEQYNYCIPDYDEKVSPYIDQIRQKSK